MKVLIFGLDGLEYSFVERLGLDHLKQAEYGKIVIPRECFLEKGTPSGHRISEPWTPLVWRAFLCGNTDFVNSKKKDYFYPKWNNAFVQFFMKKTRWLSPSIRKKNVKTLYTLGFHHTLSHTFCNLQETFFRFAKNPHDINVPCYSEGWNLKFVLDKEGEDKFKAMVNIVEKQYASDTKKLFECFGKEWDLIFIWLRLTDTLGELFYDGYKTLRAYVKIDNLVYQAKQKLKNGALVLVVSDHGIKRLDNTNFGVHSDYGFYSSNFFLGLDNPKITDFYEIVKDYLLHKNAR